MKSQDIGLLLKLVSLQKREAQRGSDRARKAWPDDWQGWEPEDPPAGGDVLAQLGALPAFEYSARGLAAETGISKSQISLSLNRCIEIGLAIKDRKLGVPRANTKALYEFILYGLRYVFPARPGRITRGIATAFAAPVLQEKLMSAGEFQPVWADARGNTKGMEVAPLFKSAPQAVKRDPEMYALLALVDAIRIGQPRERNLAAKLLKQHLELPE
ncbi:hypothetical protein Misp06_02164 [Microbulbifer sp. NBRC 101763]|uniref:hypothetical protein n=1 Tax=Microbulbifer sp. NBRC 101763 TaxID=1113820 RepID=UPI00309CEC06